MAKKTKKKDETLTLENVLWNCRVALRGVGYTEKNRDAVIGLVFLKFANFIFFSNISLFSLLSLICSLSVFALVVIVSLPFIV